MTREELLQTAKPILFNIEMVRAILDGRKTCTRRVCKDVNAYMVPDMEFYNANKRTYAIHNYADREHTEPLSLIEKICPICPGDILYVRETFQNCCRHTVHSPLIHSKYCYRASNESVFYGCIEECGTICNWKPSIHMPKEAARIFLKVTDVRVERLQDIDIDGIRNEGLSSMAVHAGDTEIALKEWEILWNSTIKKSDIETYGWDANPWVWVIEFERIEV